MSTFNYDKTDFFGFRDSLKTYLSAQDEFKDYNFTGSNLSHLIDLLAYNTHYQSAYMNFMLGESFLSSATRRNSIIAISKQLGYHPYSAQSAITTANIIVSDFNVKYPNSIILPKNTVFTATSETDTFTFYNTEEINSVSTYKDQEYASTCAFYEGNALVAKDYNAHIFPNVKLIEGTPVTNYFEVTDANNQKFIIMNKNIDTNTIKVFVYPNISTMYNIMNGNVIGQYTEFQNYMANPNAENLFLCTEMDNEYFELRFPKNTLELKNAIRIEYNVCNGSKANDISTLKLANTKLWDAKTVNITLTENTHNGCEKEDIESIRENTPLYYAAQERAVVDNDYKGLLINKFGYIDRINVWGGEEIDPPEYSKVFVSIVPNTTGKLTTSQKNEIINYIKTKTVKRVTPKIIDPMTMSIGLSVTSYYDKLGSPKGSADISTLILTKIREFNTANLNKFNSKINFSKLLGAVDGAYSYINRTSISMTIYISLDILEDLQSNYNVNLGNEITSFKSSVFSVKYDTRQYYIASDDKIVKLYRINEDKSVSITNSNFGTVDLLTGNINFENTDIINATSIYLEIIPASKDIAASLQIIPAIDFNRLTITVLGE